MSRQLVLTTKVIVRLLILTTLAACGVNTSHDSNNSESAKSEWQILAGSLNYQGKLVNWQLDSVENCPTCEITTDRVFHPSGPLVLKWLKINQRIIAIKGETIDPWLTFKSATVSQRIPMHYDFSNQQAYLLLSADKTLLSKEKLIRFDFENRQFQLWVESIKFSQPSANSANEQVKVKIEYLLLAEPS